MPDSPLRDCRLYLITDRTLQRGRSNEEVIRAAALGGVDTVQYREKGGEIPRRKMYEEVLRLRRLARELGVRFIVNDQLDLALAVGADGVHLGQNDLPASAARRILPPGMSLGISAGTLEEARSAVADGADTVGFGPVFTTATKSDAPAGVGLNALQAVIEAIEEKAPVVPIGGINSQTIDQVLKTGARRAAVISAVVAAEDITLAARGLIDSMKRAGLF